MTTYTTKYLIPILFTLLELTDARGGGHGGGHGHSHSGYHSHSYGLGHSDKKNSWVGTVVWIIIIIFCCGCCGHHGRKYNNGDYNNQQ